MAKVKINSMTEKGVLKQAVRDVIVAKELDSFKNNNLSDYEKAESGATMYKEYEDINGKKIYAKFTLTVSYLSPDEEKSKSSKKSSKTDKLCVVEE